ncbi:MAG: hypothetical protein IPM56_05610 [Ignavibacteriales bacterium]|nr:MAG: hypothetical protein IPM56_05610 [Ignavibacteriales bacterium]
MKRNSSIFLFSKEPIFNPQKQRNYSFLREFDSLALNSTLFTTNFQNLYTLNPRLNLTLCFDNADKNYVPSEILKANITTLYSDMNDPESCLKVLSEKYFSFTPKNLMIFSHTIGISLSHIQKIFGLLSKDDETLVVGTGDDGTISLLGFNNFNRDFFGDFQKESLTVDNLLRRVEPSRYFIFMMKNFINVLTLDDFKLLYKDLSRRESWTYCSQEMHERFTNLFIEYKELLR